MRSRRRPAVLALVVLALAAAVSVAVLAGAGGPTGSVDTAAAQGTTGRQAGSAGDEQLVRRGEQLFADACSACHGPQGRGIEGRGIDLKGQGEAAADFVLRTGRMPLGHPDAEPMRAKPIFGDAEIRALVAYVGTIGGGGGPAIPNVDPARGDLKRGRELFTLNCAGCHQSVAQGGIGTGFAVPDLMEATPTQIGEAMRVGPYAMPVFGERQLSSADVDDIAAYVTDALQQPDDRGGWGIGHLGPITEGLIAMLLAGGIVLLMLRRIGERR